MEPTVFFTVLGAAVLHAAWNVLVKHASDQDVSMTAVFLGHVPYAVIALLFVPAPARESWPYLAARVVFHKSADCAGNRLARNQHRVRAGAWDRFSQGAPDACRDHHHVCDPGRRVMLRVFN